MARRGDAIYRRNRTWWLDFVHRGDRYVVRIGSNINRTVAKEIAQVERARILRGEAGIGKKQKDITFAAAKALFLAWVDTNKRPNTARSYRECLLRLEESFAGKRLSEITPFPCGTAQARQGEGRGARCAEPGDRRAEGAL
jgi:hypothetical protein